MTQEARGGMQQLAHIIRRARSGVVETIEEGDHSHLPVRENTGLRRPLLQRVIPPVIQPRTDEFLRRAHHGASALIGATEDAVAQASGVVLQQPFGLMARAVALAVAFQLACRADLHAHRESIGRAG